MASVNKVILIGNLTRDPEKRYTPNGTAMARFGLAMNRKYRQGEDWKEDVTFVDIVVWGKQAESASRYLAKGRQVCIEGWLSLSRWVTDSGENRSKLEVVTERVTFLGGGKSNQEPESDPGQDDDDDDVPF